MRPIFHCTLAAALSLLPVGVTGQQPSNPTAVKPSVSLATEPSQKPRVDAVMMSMDAKPAATAHPAEPGDPADHAFWSGRYFRCPGLASGHRILAAVARGRPRTAEAADPAFRRAIAAERCLPAPYEAAEREGYADSEMEGAGGFEFEEDGQSVQLISLEDRHGRQVTLIYAQGAC